MAVDTLFAEHLDHLDADLFSGDTLYSEENRAAFRKSLGRWLREMSTFGPEEGEELALNDPQRARLAEAFNARFKGFDNELSIDDVVDYLMGSRFQIAAILADKGE